jgi:hypothetical protein
VGAAAHGCQVPVVGAGSTVVAHPVGSGTLELKCRLWVTVVPSDVDVGALRGTEPMISPGVARPLLDAGQTLPTPVGVPEPAVIVASWRQLTSPSRCCTR